MQFTLPLRKIGPVDWFSTRFRGMKHSGYVCMCVCHAGKENKGGKRAASVANEGSVQRYTTLALIDVKYGKK